MRRRFFTFAAVTALVLGAVGIANAVMPDFGSQRDQLLDSQAQARFGVQGGSPNRRPPRSRNRRRSPIRRRS